MTGGTAAVLVVGVYLLASAFLISHTLLQIRLLAASRSYEPPSKPNLNTHPMVTVQLPAYNEPNVIAGLLETVNVLDYPPDRLEIQVLDDSTDQTPVLIRRYLDSRTDGPPMTHVTRQNRDGFKAGALAHGLANARGEVIAIFDADFRPPKSFLLDMVPLFLDPKVGAVQGRWAHSNRTESWFTRVQSLFLDVHLSVEQPGRSALGAFINFNGTAGLWRTATIHDSGGWSGKSLTEDLDLSYRAQLRGWKILFDHDTTVPAELPPTLDAFRVQQFRWMKGVAENARQHISPVMSADLPARVKAHAIGHLLETMVFPSMALFALLSWPLSIMAQDGIELRWLALNPLMLSFFFLLAPVYLDPHRRLYDGSGLTFLGTYLGFIVLSMGMAVHNAVAALSGVLGITTPFERTPKRGSDRRVLPFQVSLGRTFILETVVWAVICVILVTGVQAAWYPGLWPLVVMFLGMTLILGSLVKSWFEVTTSK